MQHQPRRDVTALREGVSTRGHPGGGHGPVVLEFKRLRGRGSLVAAACRPPAPGVSVQEPANPALHFCLIEGPPAPILGVKEGLEYVGQLVVRG